jgi:hypothetical protein
MLLNIFSRAAGWRKRRLPMVDFFGFLATGFVIVFAFATLLAFADLSPPLRLAFATGAALWVGLALAAGAAGWLTVARPAPVVGLFVALPLLAAALFAWPVLMSVPLQLMIGLNIGRIVAFEFLALQAAGRLSGPFPVSAALGDIITAVLALPMLVLVRDPARHALPLHAWNLFGMADLLLALTLGVTSAQGSPLQVFPPPGSAAMQALPFSLIPTVLVPVWLMMHGAIFVRLRRARLSPSPRAPG